jgi:excisionase family DNA binding protein
MMALTARAAHPGSRSVGTGPADGRNRALYRVPEAMQLLSLSRSMIYTQIRSGRLRSVKQGNARLIPADAIAEYVALLQAEAEASQ